MSQNEISVALVGAGDFGINYLNHLLASAQVKLVGVADKNEEVRTRVSNQNQIPVFESLEKLLQKQRPMALILCTPPTAHIDDLMLAVDHKLPTLVEKPVVANRAGLDYLHSLSPYSRQLITPAHLTRHLESVRLLRQRLKNQKIKLINAWRYVPKERLKIHGHDHPALSAMIHDLDLVQSVQPLDLETMHVDYSRSKTDLPHPDSVVVTFKTKSDAIVVVGNSWSLPNSNRYVEASFDVITESEKLSLKTPSDSLAISGKEGDEFPAPELGLSPSLYGGGAFGRQLDAFLSSVAQDTHREVSLDDAIETLELAIQISEKSK